ncbi:MAG: DUF523 and DUF1722 domain-containing protein [Gammaproteobacteria bacterium]
MKKSNGPGEVAAATEEQAAIPVGVSSCLLGQKVRFDGGHKRNALVTDVLARYFRYVPACPELAIGLGAPRPALRLSGRADGPRLVGARNPGLDVTDTMARFARERIAALEAISGYILKSGSPSCGMERVKVYADSGMPERSGVGLFARELMERMPWLPVEEEGRLHDPLLRENFIERVFVYDHWRRTVAPADTPAALVRFHSEHKFIILSRGAHLLRELGRLVAQAGCGPLETLKDAYLTRLMDALRSLSSRGRHANVVQHLAGFIKQSLSGDDKAEMQTVIDAYRHGTVPLVVPLTLLRHHLRRAPQPYVLAQRYLQPYPEELGLRNAI